MTISETMQEFNKDFYAKKGVPPKYSCAGMLNLPIAEPQHRRDHFHSYLCSMSFDNMQFLQTYIDKFNSGVVVDISSTKMNHEQYPIIDNTFDYVNQIYSQWETIANNNGIKLDDKFALQKQSIIESFEEHTKTFKTFSKFITDYSKVYKSYYD